MLAVFYWDPPRKILQLPFLTIHWYGLFFALGFFLAHHLLQRLLRRDFEPLVAKKIGEKLLTYVVIGTIVGARLGHLLFYENIIDYLRSPLRMLAVWEGGLASHGGIVAIFLMLLLFLKRERLYPYSLKYLLDTLVLPSCIAAFFIRLGNFFNQEILGVATHAPWGVYFGHPCDGGISTPRHPAQLYEGIFYFVLLFPLYLLWKKRRREGVVAGLFFILLFCFRFFIEFIKEEQSVYAELPLQMGQLLSLPLILFGFYLLRKEKVRVEV